MHNLDIDYHHNNNEHKGLDVLGIKGNNLNRYFCFASILHCAKEQDIRRFTMSKSIGVFKTQAILKGEFPIFLAQHSNVVDSPRWINKPKSNKANPLKLNNKMVTKINSLLSSTNLSIKMGVYGKKSIQIYAREILLEKRIIFPDNLSLPEDFANYIIERYKKYND